MEGLEATEINSSNLSLENDIFRIDAEFFNKRCEQINNMICSLNHIFINKSNIVSGPFGSTLKSDCYIKEGIPFVRIENIKGGFDIDTTNIIYISEFDNNRLQNSQLKTNDIVLSKVGNSIGYFARVDESIQCCNISENNIGIKLCGIDDVKKLYILTYLNCSFAQQLVLRRRSGNAQPKLNVGDIAYIPIPLFSNDLENKISELVLLSKQKIDLSKLVYSEAEDILLNELELKYWKPAEQQTAEKTFADFLTSGRFDAEYYQPKYDELFEHLKKYETKPLVKIAAISKSIEPGSDAYQERGIPFIRVANLSKYGLSDTDIFLDQEEYKGVIRPKKDSILMSKDGSVGIAYKVQQDLNAITSGAILHLTIIDDNFLPDYLTLVINSILVKMQADRDAGGSIIQHWKPSEIEQVIIPKLDKGIQQQIKDKIEESFALRAESKRLLDLAKTAVETAIKQGEEKALELIVHS